MIIYEINWLAWPDPQPPISLLIYGISRKTRFVKTGEEPDQKTIASYLVSIQK
jgi:hypothetical protein